MQRELIKELCALVFLFMVFVSEIEEDENPV